MNKELLTQRNNIHISGSGEDTLFFIHGYGCNQVMWRYIVPEYQEKYTIVLIDLVGTGLSDSSAYQFNKYSTLQAYADDIIEICEIFNLKNIHLIGHSVSSIIAALATIKKPSLFKKLIMLCPSPRYINDENYIGGFQKNEIEQLIEVMDLNYFEWVSNITKVISSNPDKPEISKELETSFCKNNPEIAIHFAKLTFGGDNREDLKYITVPTLVIQSKIDYISPVEVGEFVNKSIKCSEFIIIDALGHTPHLSAPNEVIKAINLFL
jgi:sigma-B regulation protein RsbQ